MNERAIVAVLLAVAVTAPARAQDECGSELKSVVAVYSNRHDTAGPQFLTWDIYLMDPEDLDAAVRHAESELARRLRAGELDDRLDELTERLCEHVRRKLEVARPGYEETS